MMKPPASTPVHLQGQVTLRKELIAAGYTDNQIGLRVRSGQLHRIRRGAYCSGEVWRSLDAAGRHRMLCRAVLRTAHPLTVLTHSSAAIELGLPVWGVDLDVVHTTRTDGRSGRHERDWVQHRGRLPDDQVMAVDGARVSMPARCAIEMTTIATVEPALVTVNAILHTKAATLAELAQLARDVRHWPQSLTTDLVLTLACPDMESVAETRTDYLCYMSGLPRPRPQVPILDEGGREFARVDFAWEEYGVFLEFDGRIKYERFRREGETLEQFVMREKRREERICALTGWVCIRITWADLQNPAATAARIRALLASRRSAASGSAAQAGQ